MLFPFICSWLGGSEECVSYHVALIGMFCEGIIYFDVPSLCRYLDETNQGKRWRVQRSDKEEGDSLEKDTEDMYFRLGSYFT